MPIHTTTADGIARIVLDAPPVNALTDALVDELLAALAAAGDDPAVRVVLLTSAVPRRFCAGLDLSALAGASPEQIAALLDKLYVRLAEVQTRLGKPSIAVVGGAARVDGAAQAAATFCTLAVTPDGREGVAAYGEKRAPRWGG